MSYTLQANMKAASIFKGSRSPWDFPMSSIFNGLDNGMCWTNCLAAWLVIDENDIPLNPRIIGKPGVGKTTLAYAAAKQLQ